MLELRYARKRTWSEELRSKRLKRSRSSGSTGCAEYFTSRGRVMALGEPFRDGKAKLIGEATAVTTSFPGSA